MKIWITKWALNSGIEEREIDARHDIEGTHVRYFGVAGSCWLNEGDWHRTKIAALKDAKYMAEIKKYELGKQREQLHLLETLFQHEIELEHQRLGTQ